MVHCVYVICTCMQYCITVANAMLCDRPPTDMHKTAHRKTRSVDRMLMHATAFCTLLLVTSLHTSSAQPQGIHFTYLDKLISYLFWTVFFIENISYEVTCRPECSRRS